MVSHQSALTICNSQLSGMPSLSVSMMAVYAVVQNSSKTTKNDTLSNVL